MLRRWPVLFLVSFLMGCNNYCYDNPAALYKPLGDSFATDPNFETMYDLLYSIYSVPNIFLPMAGGMLVDKIGLYFSLNLFSALIFVGQLVIAVGCSMGSLPTMLAGRFIFGLGGESISVAQSALVERWFTTGELAFALGASLSLARFGSVINNSLSPYIASATYSVAAPFWFGVLLCALALVCGGLLLLLDRHATESIRANEALDVMPSPPPMTRFHVSPDPSPMASPIASPLPTRPARPATGTGHAPGQWSAAGLAAGSAGGSCGCGSPLAAPRMGAGRSAGVQAGANATGGGMPLQQQPYSQPQPSQQQPSKQQPSQPRAKPREPRSRLAACCSSVRYAVSAVSSDVVKLPRAFWLLTLLCAIVYGAVLPFNNIASALLLERDYFPQGSTWDLPGHFPNGTDANSTDASGTGASGTGASGTGASGTSRHFVFRGRPPPGVDCMRPSGQRTAFCVAQAKAQAKANLVMSEPYTLSALLTPLLGSGVDRWGGRSTLILVSASALVIVHLLLGLTQLPAEYVLLGLGLGYSIFASVVWPAIPAVVERRFLGTAYGLVTSCQNFGLFLLPLLVSLVLQSSQLPRHAIDPNPYSMVEVFFAALSACGVAAGLMLNADAPVRIALNTPGGSLATDATPASSPVPPRRDEPRGTASFQPGQQLHSADCRGSSIVRVSTS
jgi:MFS family permease